MLDLNDYEIIEEKNYEPSEYKKTLVNMANSVIFLYREKIVNSIKEVKNTFNHWVYVSNKELVRDINYETILDDVLLYIDENIQKQK